MTRAPTGEVEGCHSVSKPAAGAEKEGDGDSRTVVRADKVERSELDLVLEREVNNQLLCRARQESKE